MRFNESLLCLRAIGVPSSLAVVAVLPSAREDDWVTHNEFSGKADFVVQAGVVNGDIVYAPVAVASSSDPVDATARELAQQVSAQWREEARSRGLFDPAPIPVPWRTMRDPGYRDHPHLVGTVADGSVEDLDALVEAFLALRQRRLVVLGAAGSGKTTLAVLLVLKLIQRLGPADPVPVLCSLSSWEPSREHLDAWLEKRLLRDYPQLSASRARALIETRRVLPVLDGLDELPPTRRPVAVRELNRALADGGPVILTCRTEAYLDAVRSTDVVRSAAVIEAQPVPAAAVAAYLRGSVTPRQTARWQPVMNVVLGQPTGPLAMTLSVPLFLWLVRIAYRGEDSEPGALANRQRFPNVAAIERHLLDVFIPAAFLTGPAPPQRQGQRRQRTWRAECATRWLTELASQLTHRGTEDLAWWELFHRSTRPTYLLVWASIYGGFVGTLAVFMEHRSGDADTENAMNSLICLVYAATLPWSKARRDGRFGSFWSNIWRLVRQIHPVLWGMAVTGGLSVAATLGLRGVASLSVLAAAVLTMTVIQLLLTWLMANAMSFGDLLEAVTPQRSVARSRRRTVISVLGLPFVIIPVVAGPALAAYRGQDSLPSGIEMAVIALVCTMIAALAASPYGQYLQVRLKLSWRRRVPCRLSAFLADAHQRGVLRQVGSVYQFRHAKLRERLVETHRTG